jgi:phage tail tape-measure protein
MGHVPMCGKWYRGTLDRDGGEFDSEDEEKAAPVCPGRERRGVCRGMSRCRRGLAASAILRSFILAVHDKQHMGAGKRVGGEILLL